MSMAAAAAARNWWAALRRRSGKPSGTAVQGLAASRLTASVLPAFAGCAVVCALIGLAVTIREDDRLSAGRYAALRHALDDVHASLGDNARVDAAELALIERRSGLHDLRFDTDETGAAGREVQSVHDARGRIVGWLSWAPGRDLIRALIWLWGFVGALALGLAACAMLVAGTIRRLGRALAASSRSIRKLTSEDALTGLPNHRMMLENLEQALLKRGSGTVVLALIDLDGFREVNETQGRVGGDALIKGIAERLEGDLPPGALFGRFEDDEFAVVMTTDDIGAPARLAETLRAALSRPIVMEQNWHISAGIGIVQAPADGERAEELSRRAGLALRAAKRQGRGAVRRFEPAIEIEHSERLFIRRELASAITAGGLEVHYQPVVAAAGGGIVAVEALARWTHPSRGAIAPSVFIPLAEQSGLMSGLGEFVLRRALADGARWPNLSIAVNLSPLQIRDPKLVDLVAAMMAETGIAPSRVMLEVTEGVLIEDPHETLHRLEALRALGLSIALDDFGTGYSSLSYLQKFPFSQLKIDRAFVASLGTTGNAGAIIQSIVTLGHALGMKVLAEGVETDEQRVLLRLAGCDEMQGYLFAKPRPAEAIDKVLARAAGRAASRPAAGAAS
jgi:diguanylate cyclase (GGDEF)-like protein